MKKLCIALVSALAFGAVNAEETDLVVVGSGGAGRATESAAITTAETTAELLNPAARIRPGTGAFPKMGSLLGV